jgi:hypothetical protein
MSYTQKILGEFISRIDTNEKYTRNELGKILTKVYHEIKNPKKPKRKTPFDFFIEQNREKIKEIYPNLSEKDILRLLKSRWNTKLEEEKMKKIEEEKRKKIEEEKRKKKEKAAKLNRIFIEHNLKEKLKKMITLASHPSTPDAEAFHSKRRAEKLMQIENLKIEDIFGRRDKEILDNYKKRWG